MCIVAIGDEEPTGTVLTSVPVLIDSNICELLIYTNNIRSKTVMMIGIPIKNRETIYLFDNKDLRGFINEVNDHSESLIKYDTYSYGRSLNALYSA